MFLKRTYNVRGVGFDLFYGERDAAIQHLTIEVGVQAEMDVYHFGFLCNDDN